ncbi:FtsX-like permease family protein [Sinanaerobacter chloroacetimidivorans]|uniref:ABC transporter permease n=1 Tax=Sinanaerobacter chloroacetimidivorans TaxID=2818044 RepID=A0A8J7W7P3_9FIRM|nr:ABC transporter permease [Sinanaerobacter chloroacetimidivorans]MBR0600395.1 ABC transporter permease [Sinanaerobacter chloroacetimidivorans]
MNLFTLALRNIRLNHKKYIMYFFSMSFSVFTAYTFLALMQNEYVKMAFQYDTRYQALLSSFGVIILVFVLFYLISSNNSFIKARKKEISTYSLFGMTNGKIGGLLFIETMMVGILTLLVGIGAGIFFSKLTAMFLLNLSLSNFIGDVAFSIDPMSMILTAAIFLFIFCIMGLSGLWVIHKFELVDLFKAEKLSEGRSKGSVLVLVLSVLLIGAGYILACNHNAMVVVLGAIPILLLVISGTYLFFWGGLPKVLSIIAKNKSTYYKGVNLVSATSFGHRMKSIASVMATIAVLSAVATTAIATGFTLYSNIEKNTYAVTGYDLSFYGTDEILMDEVLKIIKEHKSEAIDSYQAKLYSAAVNSEAVMVDGYEFLSEGEHTYRVYSQSDYNQLISYSKSNLKPVEADAGQVVYLYPYSADDIEEAMKGQVLTFSEKKIAIEEVLRSGAVSFGENHVLILNDGDFNELLQRGDIVSGKIGEEPQSAMYGMLVNYKNSLDSKALNNDLESFLSSQGVQYRTAYNLYNESLETFGLICFIGFFMSAVFILMTASLLYFKQVMAAEEEKHQYKMLRKIGLDSGMEKQIIKKRLLPVFFIPLVMGIIHSVFAMKTADTVVFSNMIRGGHSYLTVLGFSSVMYGVYAVIYGIFYMITKNQYARAVK